LPCSIANLSDERNSFRLPKQATDNAPITVRGRRGPAKCTADPSAFVLPNPARREFTGLTLRETAPATPEIQLPLSERPIIEA
jgi:hypothetical protein